jgi:thymidine phosphorylase
MTDREDALELAESLVATGRRMDVKTSAILSDMQQPLGQMVGNACEVNEAIEILRGGGPEDARTLTVALCADLLVAAGRFHDLDQASASLEEQLNNATALERFKDMVEAQGATFRDALPCASEYTVEAKQSGYLKSVDGVSLGNSVISLGGGRRKLGDPVLHDVGLRIHKKVGDEVVTGEPLMTVYARSRADFDGVHARLTRAIAIDSDPVPANRLYERL